MGIIKKLFLSTRGFRGLGLSVILLLGSVSVPVQAANDGLSSTPAAVLQAVKKDKPGIILQSAQQSSRDDGAHYLVKGVLYGKEIRFIVRYDGKIIYSVDVKR